MSDDAIYEKFELMICQLCWKAVKRYGGDYDEYYSEAAEGFMQAVRRFQPEKGLQLSTYIFHWVRGRLLTFASRRNRLVLTDDLDTPCHFRTISDMFMDWGADARYIMECLRKDTPSLMRNLREAVTEKAGLFFFLKEVGWAEERIRAAFTEIEGSLT